MIRQTHYHNLIYWNTFYVYNTLIIIKPDLDSLNSSATLMIYKDIYKF